MVLICGAYKTFRGAEKCDRNITTMKPLEIVAAEPGPDVADRAVFTPQVDIVVPVKDEERDLAPSVRRLCAFLRDEFPFSARITIADNGSTDRTWAVATALRGRRARRVRHASSPALLKPIRLITA